MMNQSVSPPASTAPLTFVYFLAGAQHKSLLEQVQTLVGPKDLYQILEVVPVCGQRLEVQSNWHMVRVETSASFSPSNREVSGVVFKGNVRHLQYPSGVVRAELQEKSAPPIRFRRPLWRF